jgi:hypothetical protein
LADSYRPSIRGSLAVIDRSKPESAWDLTGEVILFHEYTHHFMLKYAPFPYSAWYSEGFAEYYSSTKFLDDDVEGLDEELRSYYRTARKKASSSDVS